MVNILISDENIYYATYLMNCINDKNKNVRVIGIVKNGLETIKKIENNDIDIILLNLIMIVMIVKSVIMQYIKYYQEVKA